MPHILVIDDEQAVRTVTELMLRRDGHHVEVAASGKAGVEAVGRTSFDLILVDMFMPSMNGPATIACIREVAPAVPIIAMSGMAVAHDVGPETTTPEALCVVGWLQKPFRPADLQHLVAAALGRSPVAAKTAS